MSWQNLWTPANSRPAYVGVNGPVGPVVDYVYFRPDGSSYFNRPDGSSTYIRA